MVQALPIQFGEERSFRAGAASARAARVPKPDAARPARVRPVRAWPGITPAAAALAVAAHIVLIVVVARSVWTKLPVPLEAAGFPLILQTAEAVGAAPLTLAAPALPMLTPPAPMSILTRPAEAVLRPQPAYRAIASAAMPRILPALPPKGVPGSGRPGVPAAADTSPDALANGKAAAALTTDQAPAAPAADTPRNAFSNEAALRAGLEDLIDAAVRRAAVMPDAARRQHREGRTRLRFVYQDGAVDGIQIVQSSESRLLDDAAVTALRAAHYPKPPAPMRGRQLDLLVWIDFRMAAAPG